MSDPLTALMHAVQVMNFLKTLILKTLREREEADVSGYSDFSCSPSHEPGEDDDDDSQRDMDMCDDSSEITSDNEPAEISILQSEMGANDSDSAARCSSERHTSSQHCNRTFVEEEYDSLSDIEVCFLRQLEWKSNDGILVEKDIASPLCPDSNPLIERKEENSITSNGESEVEVKNDPLEEQNESREVKMEECKVDFLLRDNLACF